MVRFLAVVLGVGVGLAACKRERPVTTFDCAQCHAAEVMALRDSLHARGQAVATSDLVPPGEAGGFRVSHVDGGVVVSWLEADGGRSSGPARFTVGVEPFAQVAVETRAGVLLVPPIGWLGDGGWRALPNEAGDWRGSSFSWNGACAPCHATGFHVGVLEDGGFESTFASLSVSCAACHGDEGGHRRWLDEGKPAHAAAGFGFSLRQRASFSFEDGGAIARPGNVGEDVQTGVCAACHARRRALVDDGVTSAAFFDRFEPGLISRGLYASDGMALDEVYEFGSFLMSRMHRAGVRCSDCHQPHGGRLRAGGDAVCARCHRPAVFEATSHHGHAAGQVSCAGCHLPTVRIAGVDDRHDHSLRRPTERVCAGCHERCVALRRRGNDETARALAEAAVQVRGDGGTAAFGTSSRKESALRARGDDETRTLGTSGRHESALRGDDETTALGTSRRQQSALRVRDDETTQAFAALFGERADARWRLEQLMAREEVSSFERGSALALFSGPWLPGDSPLLERAARGDEWLRYGVARALPQMAPELRVKVGAPLLADQRRAIRVQAGRALTGLVELPPDVARAIDEAERVNAFRGEAWLTRSELARARGENDASLRALEEGLRRDPAFVPLEVNLADQRREEAVARLSEAVRHDGPWRGAAAYALGLARWRAHDREGARVSLEEAAKEGDATHLVAWCLAERDVRGKAAGWAALDASLVRHQGMEALLSLWARWAEEDRDAVRAAAARDERARWAPR